MPDPDALYRARCVSAPEAAASITDGSNLILGMACGMPPAFAAALGDRARAGGITALDVYYMHSIESVCATLFAHDLMPVVRPHPLFMSHCDRALAAAGLALGQDWVDYVPCAFHQAGRLLTENISPDCFAVTVSPMDRHGYMSLGTNCDYGSTVLHKATRVIVEVNRHMPRTFGECSLHVSDVDLIIEHDAPLMETLPSEADVQDEAIAALISREIPNGATLQMGVGGVPAQVLRHLAHHEDLGLHSELFTPPMVDLIRSGVLNGRRKTLMPHKHVYTLALGDRAMFDFMDDNPAIVGYPAAWTNEPNVIRKNANMISVNAAMEVDLTGQVNSESLGGRQYSGTGGQLDFVRGAYNSPGGKSFVALHSTAKSGTLSRIVPRVVGGAVTDPRLDVHHVVTEYGCVNLKGRSLKERARLLIDIAHPDFREQLQREAHAMGLA